MVANPPDDGTGEPHSDQRVVLGGLKWRLVDDQELSVIDFDPMQAAVSLDQFKNVEIPDGPVVLITCQTKVQSPSGWNLTIQGVDADEVERVTLALMQSTDAQPSTGRDVVRGDKYVVIGGVGAVGSGAQASVVNTWNSFISQVDTSELVAELRSLRQSLTVESLDEASIAGALANAESAVLSGDGAGVLAWLRKAGKKCLEIAQVAGTEVVATALKKALGLG